MSKKIESDAQFFASLSPAQRDYYLSDLKRQQEHLQAAFRDLSRGMGLASQLNSELLERALQQQASR